MTEEWLGFLRILIFGFCVALVPATCEMHKNYLDYLGTKERQIEDYFRWLNIECEAKAKDKNEKVLPI